MRGMSWYYIAITRARKKDRLVETEDNNLFSPMPRSYATSSEQAKIFIIVMTGKQHVGRRHIQILPFDLTSTTFVRSQIWCLWSARLSVPLHCHLRLTWQWTLGEESPHTLLYYISLVILLKSWTVLRSNRWHGGRGSRNKIWERKLNWKDLNFN